MRLHSGWGFPAPSRGKGRKIPKNPARCEVAGARLGNLRHPAARREPGEAKLNYSFQLRLQKAAVNWI